MCLLLAPMNVKPFQRSWPWAAVESITINATVGKQCVWRVWMRVWSLYVVSVWHKADLSPLMLLERWENNVWLYSIGLRVVYCVHLQDYIECINHPCLACVSSSPDLGLFPVSLLWVHGLHFIIKASLLAVENAKLKQKSFVWTLSKTKQIQYPTTSVNFHSLEESADFQFCLACSLI